VAARLPRLVCPRWRCGVSAHERSSQHGHRHGYSCEQAELEIDSQMSSKLEAQQCLRLICVAIAQPLDNLADGWKASLPIILARLELIVDEAERAFRERDALRAALAEASTHVHDCEELLTPATRRLIKESVAVLTDV
jgi:hypothetical protein